MNGGFAFKSKDYSESGRFVLRTLNIQDDGTISIDNAVYLPESLASDYQRFELREHDTLFVMVGATLGKIGRVQQKDLPALLNQNMWRIRAKTQKTHPRFLYYAFREAVKANLAFSSGSARDFVRRDDYRKLRISCPPFREQERVGKLLGALDDKIELIRRMNGTLEAIARSLFKAWFVDFEPVHANHENRPSTSASPEIAKLFPSTFEDSIPKGWTVGKVGDFCSVNKNTLNRSDHLEILQYVEISEVLKGVIHNVSIYERGSEPSRAKRKLAHGDAVVSTVRPDRGSYFLAFNPNFRLP